MPDAQFIQTHTSGTAGSGTAISCTLAAAVPAANLIVVFFGFDNTSATAPTINTVSKPGGESATWVRQASHNSSSATSAAGVRGELWAILTTVQWAQGTVITGTLSASPPKSTAVCREYTSVLNTLRSISGTGTSTAGTPTASSTGTAPVVGDLAVGAATFETSTNPTVDSDTTAGSWSTATIGSATGGGSAAQVRSIIQHKIVTGVNPQTYNPTQSSDSGAVIAVFQKNALTSGIVASNHGFTAPAIGVPVSTGVVATNFVFDAPAVGTADDIRIVPGVVDENFGFTAPAIGVPVATGSTVDNFVLTTSAIGVPVVVGSTAINFGFTAPASGSKVATGLVASNLGFTAPAVGVRFPVGVATGNFGFDASVAASRVVVSTNQSAYGDGTYGTGRYGTTWSWFSADALGFTPDAPAVTGVATGVFGFNSSADASRIEFGAADGSFGFVGFAIGPATPDNVLTGGVLTIGQLTGAHSSGGKYLVGAGRSVGVLVGGAR